MGARGGKGEGRKGKGVEVEINSGFNLKTILILIKIQEILIKFPCFYSFIILICVEASMLLYCIVISAYDLRENSLRKH